MNDHASRAANLLSSAAPPPETVGESDRARAIDAIAKAIVARKRRQLGQRAAIALSLVAAGLLLFAKLRPSTSFVASNVPSANRDTASTTTRVTIAASNAVSLAGGGEASVQQGATLEKGARLIAQATGAATLAFSTGTEVVLGAGGDMSLVEVSRHQRLSLSKGSIAAHVAKLGDGERFIVTTDDAEVEVRGTRFEVRVGDPSEACAKGAKTRVVVSEGVVVVRHGGEEVRVAAGGRWPTACGDEPARESSTAADRSGPAIRKSSGAAAPSPSEATSRLAEQNDLFAEAISAKKSGDLSQANVTLALLLSRYPNGPLAESASAERMRVLGAMHSTEAVGAARNYVKRYPRGFAREEADALLGGAK